MMDIRNTVDQQQQQLPQHAQPHAQSHAQPQAQHQMPPQAQPHPTQPVPFTPQQARPQADRWRQWRLGFEALLIALCGYLIGVAGLPPLFDAPGGPSDSQLVTTSATDDGSGVASPVADEAATTVNQTPGAGVSVTTGRATWTTGYFQAALFKALLEELGYTVGSPADNEMGPAEIYPLMADGSVDYWTNSWIPNHITFMEADAGDGSKVADHVTVLGSLLPSGGLEGVLITKSVAEENQIATMGQINDDPALVSLFDSDGNGKAEVYGCPEDWTCDDILDEVLAFNGWDNLEQVKSDYETMVDNAVTAVDANQPILQYTWSPSGYLTRLRPGDNALWLSIGTRENMPDGSITPDFDFNDGEPAALAGACTSDPCWLGWPAADIQVTARNAFLEANPSARVLFEQAQLKVLDVALANVKYDSGEESEEDLARHAQEWITENRATVDGWLAAARAAG